MVAASRHRQATAAGCRASLDRRCGYCSPPSKSPSFCTGWRSLRCYATAFQDSDRGDSLPFHRHCTMPSRSQYSMMDGYTTPYRSDPCYVPITALEVLYIRLGLFRSSMRAWCHIRGMTVGQVDIESVRGARRFECINVTFRQQYT